MLLRNESDWLLTKWISRIFTYIKNNLRANFFTFPTPIAFICVYGNEIGP
jgi:hypothetical protein